MPIMKPDAGGFGEWTFHLMVSSLQHDTLAWF
jgi:hypothetical protein